MKVLVACEFSGVVRRAFRAAGHNAYSCDLLPAEDGSKFHIRGDVREHLDDDWDIMIAHPPCTYLANSGVRWLHEKDGRWEKMEKGARFFKRLFHAPIPRIAVENPIMHKYAVKIIGRRQDQVIQPWQFGHGETKATCLWLKGLPELKPTDVVKGREAKVHNEPPGPDRWKNRSRFYPGIAKAMVEQWREDDTG